MNDLAHGYDVAPRVVPDGHTLVLLAVDGAESAELVLRTVDPRGEP